MRINMMRWIAAVLLALSCIGAGPKEEVSIPIGCVKVTTAKVLDSSSCLVQQIIIEVPKGTPPAIVKSDFRWKDIIHAGGGSGYGSTDREAQRVTVTIVGQAIKPVSDNLPKILSLCVHYGSRIESQAHPIDDSQKLADVLRIDVKPGLYQLEQSIPVGQYGGQPITFQVSARALEDTKKQ